MRSGAMSRSKTVRHSLTDRILTLCTSGRFGVREAITEAILQKHKMKKKAKRHSPAQRRTGRSRPGGKLKE